jgi:hypothetical protein
MRIVRVKAAPIRDAGEATTGMKIVQKHGPRTSRLTDAERQRLIESGLQITSWARAKERRS